MDFFGTDLSSLVQALEEKINYQFSNQELLIEALTHSSTSFDRKTHLANNRLLAKSASSNNDQLPEGSCLLDPKEREQASQFEASVKSFKKSNERLEFLGDAVLQLVITRHLFELFPNFEEGKLTKIRTRLVSKIALQAYAAHLELGKYLILGRGEEASGGRKRSSILGDSFEALIGAIYLDGGLDTARSFILEHAAENLSQIALEPEDINPKGHLQELLQSHGAHAPCYELIDENGVAHSKNFRYAVLLEGKTLGVGEGKSKKEAEVAAASDALRRFAENSSAILEIEERKTPTSSPSAFLCSLRSFMANFFCLL